ncbi:uncharacterized protein BDV14DRAFT_195295 [Aspergillus stella-maris]|uniref:uncharacterized protein n=1 Tax=Aspergillus stella-maris TaxID=1810926 RepID=UPI003CCD7139
MEGNHPPILRLPDELLDNVISAVYSIDSGRGRSYTNPTHAPTILCLVCRRFHHIAVSYLYTNVRIDTRFADYWRKGIAKDPRLVHKCWSQNPSIWHLCRRLRLSCDPYRPDPIANRCACDTFLDFTTWFTQTKSFDLSSLGKDEKTWDVLRSALANFFNLTELSLRDGDDYTLELGEVLETLGDMRSSTIQSLTLDGISTNFDPLAHGQLEAQAGTASFKTLKLRSFLQTPDVMRALVKWSHTLESFDLHFTFGACYDEMGLYEYWSLATLQPILAIHRTTLRSISIRCINSGGLAGFDMRAFPRLEELCLSEGSTSPHHRDSSLLANLIPNLIAPQLRNFHWDMTLEDQQCAETLYCLQEEEENFLRAVAHAAIEAKVPLRMLRVTYNPDTWLEYEIGYPWDRLDALGREPELAAAGIRVCYNTPNISREEFDKRIEEIREREEKKRAREATPWSLEEDGDENTLATVFE